MIKLIYLIATMFFFTTSFDVSEKSKRGSIINQASLF